MDHGGEIRTVAVDPEMEPQLRRCTRWKRGGFDLGLDELGRREVPELKLEGLKGAPLYYDCATDDARLTLETALDAARAGATVAPWCAVTSYLKDDAGRVVGVVIKDQLSGVLKEVRASAVVSRNARCFIRTSFDTVSCRSIQAAVPPLRRPVMRLSQAVSVDEPAKTRRSLPRHRLHRADRALT